jgi:hypothetical protein
MTRSTPTVAKSAALVPMWMPANGSAAIIVAFHCP